MQRLLFIGSVIVFVLIGFRNSLDILMVIAILGTVFICFVEGWVKKVAYPCILVMVPKDYVLPDWIRKWVDRFVNMGYVLFTYITGVSLDIFIDPHYNLGVSRAKFLSLSKGIILLWILAAFIAMMYVYLDYFRQQWQKNPEVQEIKVYVLKYFTRMFKICALCYLMNRAVYSRNSLRSSRGRSSWGRGFWAILYK